MIAIGIIPRRALHWVALSATVCWLLPGCGQQLRVYDLSGIGVNPLADSDSTLKVFVFTQCDCPIANRYAPVINRLHEQFQSKGVTFSLIYVDPDETADEIREHMEQYAYRCTAYRDPDHQFAEATGVKITPEAAVFTDNGTLAYRGRIDDQWVDFGKFRAEATTYDLADAIDALLNGKPVANARTESLGCYIADLKAQ